MSKISKRKLIPTKKPGEFKVKLPKVFGRNLMVTKMPDGGTLHTLPDFINYMATDKYVIFGKFDVLRTHMVVSTEAIAEKNKKIYNLEKELERLTKDAETSDDNITISKEEYESLIKARQELDTINNKQDSYTDETLKRLERNVDKLLAMEEKKDINSRVKGNKLKKEINDAIEKYRELVDVHVTDIAGFKESDTLSVELGDFDVSKFQFFVYNASIYHVVPFKTDRRLTREVKNPYHMWTCNSVPCTITNIYNGKPLEEEFKSELVLPYTHEIIVSPREITVLPNIENHAEKLVVEASKSEVTHAKEIIDWRESKAHAYTIKQAMIKCGVLYKNGGLRSAFREGMKLQPDEVKKFAQIDYAKRLKEIEDAETDILLDNITPSVIYELNQGYSIIEACLYSCGYIPDEEIITISEEIQGYSKLKEELESESVDDWIASSKLMAQPDALATLRYNKGIIPCGTQEEKFGHWSKSKYADEIKDALVYIGIINDDGSYKSNWINDWGLDSDLIKTETDHIEYLNYQCLFDKLSEKWYFPSHIVEKYGALLLSCIWKGDTLIQAALTTYDQNRTDLDEILMDVQGSVNKTEGTATHELILENPGLRIGKK